MVIYSSILLVMSILSCGIALGQDKGFGTSITGFILYLPLHLYCIGLI